MNTVAAIAASGSIIPVGEAAVNAVLGYIIVFVGLYLLMLVVILFGRIMTKRTAPAESAPAAPAAPTPAAPTAPGSAGELKLYDISDRDAAMIMAIVADQMGKPLNELRFKSIREVK